MRHLTDAHAHTVASTHAYSTVEEYFRAAADKGLQLFSITDHGPEMPDSPHPWHFGNFFLVMNRLPCHCILPDPTDRWLLHLNQS